MEVTSPYLPLGGHEVGPTGLLYSMSSAPSLSAVTAAASPQSCLGDIFETIPSPQAAARDI